MKRVDLGGDVRAIAAGYVISARLSLADGDSAAAGGWLDVARPLLERGTFSDWTSRFERCQIELWLAQGRIGAAVERANQLHRDATLAASPEGEAIDLAAARALIARGDPPSVERAVEIAGRVLDRAVSENRIGVQIEALALRALARWTRGDGPGALTLLEQALTLAEPERYVRLFVDLGSPMARLLREAQARDVMPEYVNRLIEAFGSGSGTPIDRGLALAEPLSPRELEILHLMAAGLTNREIASSLYISAETVKKHSGSIYAKLGAGNRTEAAAKARELGVLG
jgi:LuxR family maltose regulon positive regulatory protein